MEVARYESEVEGGQVDVMEGMEGRYAVGMDERCR